MDYWIIDSFKYADTDIVLLQFGLEVCLLVKIEQKQTVLSKI